MADIQARKSGRIKVEFWHTDWHARIQIGTDPDCCLWLTREEAERLPNQIRKALAERSRQSLTEDTESRYEMPNTHQGMTNEILREGADRLDAQRERDWTRKPDETDVEYLTRTIGPLAVTFDPNRGSAAQVGEGVLDANTPSRTPTSALVGVLDTETVLDEWLGADFHEGVMTRAALIEFADLLRSQPVVLTLEELEALPVGGVVLDDMNFAWQLGGGGLGWIAASGYGIPPTELMEISPVRLLYRAGDGR